MTWYETWNTFLVNTNKRESAKENTMKSQNSVSETYLKLRKMAVERLRRKFETVMGKAPSAGMSRDEMIKSIAAKLSSEDQAEPKAPETKAFTKNDIEYTEATKTELEVVKVMNAVAQGMQDTEEKAESETTVDGVRLPDLTVEQLQERHFQVIGRRTNSNDKRYLVWRLHQAEHGKVKTGQKEKVKMNVLTVPIAWEKIAEIDAVWQKAGLQSRMEFFRQAVDAHLVKLAKSVA